MKIRNLLADEAAFDPLLRLYRVRADRIMVGMNLFLLLVCIAIAPLHDTFSAVLLISLPTLLLSIWLMREHPGTLATRLSMACGFMAYTGLIIHQTGGAIEAHFTAFGLIAVLLYYRDMLTDLPNRVSLQADLEQALVNWRDHATPFAVVFIDLDGFKPVNDYYGHDAGDEVLKVIGARLLQANRLTDLAARLGGDEFAIVLHDCPSVEFAGQVAQRFIEAIALPIRLDSHDVTVKVGASAGVSHVVDSNNTIDTVMKNADIALYDAKTSGKNQVPLFKPERCLRAEANKSL